MNKILQGDSLEVLKTLPDGCVQTCITSPPYFGLRDYGMKGQIGLEETLEKYVENLVEVFREVRRVLRDDGTLWLNLGDSYASNTGDRNKSNGIKFKDLFGIPWSVAFALQQPYYTGKIKDENDRVWLAAMVDAEGSICGSEYQTGNRTKTNIYISVTNTSIPIIDKCERLFPQETKHIYEKTNEVSTRRCFRWDVERMEMKSLFIREIYPYLVAKRKQAILGYTFLEMQKGLASKKKGYLAEQSEKCSLLMSSLSKLNKGDDIELPDWVIEPPPLFEPGFYLRQDIIWHKPNPMPESVTDRCTKAHEYIFLLSKSPTYYYDHEAVKEQSVSPGSRHVHKAGNKAEEYVRQGLITRPAKNYTTPETRNRRSVWTVTTKPYKGAHFATFPPDLIEPCVLAGAPVGGVVLDPFFGSGTTGAVALKHRRKYIGIELNPIYIKLAEERISSVQILL